MRCSSIVAAVALAAALLVPSVALVADESGSVGGVIRVSRGRLPMSLDRAVSVMAVDFDRAPVGRVHYDLRGGVLRYRITSLPLGTTLTVQMSLREDAFAETSIGSSTNEVPTLSRSDHSSPFYLVVLSHDRPARAPLDFDVAVTRDPAPARVSLR